MNIDVKAEVVINRPKDDVASFVMNADNDPVWISGIVETKTLTDPPLSVGTKVRRVAEFLGRRMEYVPEVVEYDPKALLVMRIDSPFEMMIRYEFEEADNGTLIRIRIQGEGTGFYKLAGPLIANTIKQNVIKDLKTLKGILESRGDAA